MVTLHVWISGCTYPIPYYISEVARLWSIRCQTFYETFCYDRNVPTVDHRIRLNLIITDSESRRYWSMLVKSLSTYGSLLIQLTSNVCFLFSLIRQSSHSSLTICVNLLSQLNTVTLSLVLLMIIKTVTNGTIQYTQTHKPKSYSKRLNKMVFYL